jgi:hypothetical protein
MPPPNIRIRGVRLTVPPGYVIGRSSPGRGPVQLLDVRNLGRIGVAGQAALAVTHAGFGFTAEGLFADNEFLGQAVWGKDVTFTSADTDSFLVAGLAATSTAAFRFYSSALVLLGTYTVAAAGAHGVLSWITDPYTHPAGTPMLVYAPTPNDATLGNVNAIVSGKT